MTTELRRTGDDTPVTALVDTLCDRFERAWHAGAAPTLAQFLPADGPVRSSALLPLACLDLELRLRADLPARAEAYFDRFPELLADPARALALVGHEWKVRRPREPGLTERAFRERFPGLSDHADWARFFPDDAADGAAGSATPTTVVDDTGADGHGPPGLPRVPGYEVLGELGRGGMGVVYKARQVKADRVVALKMILAPAHVSLREKVRFQIEAEAIARLQHSHIVQLHEVGEVGGQAFFSLEFCPGGGLDQRLKAGPLPPRAAAALAEKLAGAMHYAHSRGVVHRDLKPANVLLTAEGEPKVTDFGLAKRLDATSELSQSGQLLGTPVFMAPEQAAGRLRDVGPQTDVYALGALLYALVTGRPPFRGASLEEVLERVRTAEPEPPSRGRPGLPRDLETICLKCLAKEPAKRYASAEALTEDLRRFRAGEPIKARRVGTAERLVKWVRRRPTAAGLLAAVVLLLFTGGAGAWTLHQQRTAAQARQQQTDREARAVLERARGLMAAGWEAHDLAKLHEAVAEGARAVDIARSGGASPAVQQEVAAFREEAESRMSRAEKNRALLGSLLDVSTPPEARTFQADKTGLLTVLSQPTRDEQYAAAFRRWGLDVDGTPESEVVARLRQEPEAVVQEVIAGLDSWVQARRGRRPETEWRRLFRLAEQLDRNDRRQELRAFLADGAVPPVESVAGLLGGGSPWPALWELTRGKNWRRVQELRTQADPTREPVLTVILLAQASSAAGDNVGAEQVLRQALATRPDQVALLDTLAAVLERQGPSRQREALGCYRAIRARRPSLGIALSLALIQAGQAAEGETVLRDLLRRQPDNPETLANLGGALRVQGKLEAAAEVFRQVIELGPEFAEAYSELGSILREQQKLDEAVATCRKAIELKPTLAQAYLNLGAALGRQNKLGEAMKAFRKAIELKPDFAEAYYDLGVALQEQKELDKAITAFRRAIELRPAFAEAYNHLGLALRDQKKLAQAVAAFRASIEVRADHAEAYSNLGIALFEQGDSAGALTALRTSIKLRPEYAEAYVNLGGVLNAAGKRDEAVAAFRKAIAIRPELAVAYYNLGSVLYSQKELDQAATAFRKAIELQQDFAEAYLFLGFTLQQGSQFNEALAVLRKGTARLGLLDPRRGAFRQQIQQCERQRILDARLPAVLKGTDKPANAREQIEFAQLCALKNLHAAAARFYREAFNANPPLAEDLDSGNRYNAACAAALAGCAEGKEMDQLDEKGRALWRQQALQWFRADLTRRSKALEKGTAQTRAEVAEKMRHWQTDADLAGVRDKDALDKLPEVERQQWQQLWADVAALLRRAAG